ncbi:MAG: response regulator [Acidobacteriota bacterium]
MPRILVVEDSPIQARQLRPILESEGFEVVVASNGQEALERFRRLEPDLVLSDIVMPGLSGYELCRKMKADAKRGDTPLIFLTTLTEPSDIIEGLAAGADNYIIKPYEPEHLVDRVKSILAKKAARREGRPGNRNELLFQGERLCVTSDKEQILDYLVSAFEDLLEARRKEQERKRAEETLRESDMKFRVVMQSAVEAIILVDASTNIISWNKGAQTIFGYAEEEVLGKPVTLLIPERYRERHTRGVRRSRSTGESPIIGKTVELDGRRRDGSEFPLELSLGAWKTGEENFYCGVIRDITARKRTEEALRASQEQLRQSQKMEAIGRLAGGVAHDFNNMLTAIRGYSELVLGSLDPEDPRSRDLNEIRRAAKRASSLTRQLLAFSRRQVLELKVLDLNRVVADVEKMLRRLIGENIDLVSKLEPALGHIKADRGQVEQILMNLVVNARDAMPEGGKLTIETKNIHLDDYPDGRGLDMQPGPHVMLAVSDTGVGMDKETLARVFEPFFTTKEKDKGTGLGLSTVYGIVKQSSGHISVYSKPGRGTRFEIYLPRVEEEIIESAEFERPTAAQSQGSETILLVEDEKAVRELGRRILERNGYRMLEASNGIEALEVCKEHAGPIHLVLTDLVMPEMGGRELVEHLAVLRPETKVLYLSGYTGDTVLQQNMLTPGAAFLQKPFTVKTLSSKVREVLDAPQPDECSSNLSSQQ